MHFNRFERRSIVNAFVFLLFLLPLPFAAFGEESASVVGVAVVPHCTDENIRYRSPRDSSLAVKVQRFVQGPALPSTFGGKTPADLLEFVDSFWVQSVSLGLARSASKNITLAAKEHRARDRSRPTQNHT